jgi:hypothetical protein
MTTRANKSKAAKPPVTAPAATQEQAQATVSADAAQAQEPIDKSATPSDQAPAAQDDSEGWDGMEADGTLAADPPAAQATAQAQEPIEDAPQVPTFGENEDLEDEPVESADPGDEPLPKEYIILDGPASYGPVVINGKRVTIRKGKLYHVPNAEERADILGSGRFRAAVRKDLERSGRPSAGPGGAITRDMLPPGAIKGGLNKQ